jgi:hypothetical protein
MSCCFEFPFDLSASSSRRKPGSILIFVLVATCRKMDPGFRRDDGVVRVMPRAMRGR